MSLRPAHNYGPSIKDGRIMYTSVSSMQMHDTSTEGGCFRRWWFDKVGKKKEPQTVAQDKGIKLHGEIEHYLHTGENILGPIALAGFRHIPERENVLGIEYEIKPTESLLHADGTPLYGFIDCIAKDGADRWAIDWKTTSDFKWAKDEHELLKTIQMLGYGALLHAMSEPEVRKIGVAHVYFRTSGATASQATRVLRNRDEFAERWAARSLPVIQGMRQTVQATRAEDVEPNLRACRAFRGCGHQFYCPRSPVKVSVQMASVLERLKNKNLAQAADAATPPTGIVPPDAPGPDPALDAKPIEAPSLVPPTSPTLAAAVAAANGGTPTMSQEQFDQVARELAPPVDAPVTTLAEPATPEPAPEAPKRRKSKAPAGEVQAHIIVTQGAPAKEGPTLYIDCLPEGVQGLLDLASLVDTAVQDVAKHGGIQDCRLAPDSNALAFGRWKGAVSECAKERLAGAVKDAFLIVRGNELRAAALPGLASLFARVVRGVG